MRIKKLNTCFLATTFLALLVAATSAPSDALADGNGLNFKRNHVNFGFDVAEIGSRFVPDDDPFVDGLPAYGNSFITQGYIYLPGTLSEGNGVLPDGSPEFPERLIGNWTCFGWHTQDAATAVEGTAVVTTQIYEFSKTPGRLSFVSDGFELTFGDSTFIRRAVTGGTGPLSTVRGQVSQSFLGFPNESGGVNLRFKARLKRR